MMTLSSAAKAIIDDLPPTRPVLIAGPTASGKSALALEIATTGGGVVINADALQVFDGWRVLSARPSPTEEAMAPHALYGHVPFTQPYSVGAWLRDLTPYLHGQQRPIIVGGTGLYLSALSEGLAEIPPTPPALRAQANARIAAEGHAGLLDELDARTRARIDTANPMRVQRAWEVLQATGRALADWQDDTPAPLLARADTCALVIDAPKDWLTPRIERRFDAMLAQGALDEVAANLDRLDPALPASKAIGAAELADHLRGNLTLTEARDAAIIATRQFAKRQRNWFRGRMADWHPIPMG